MSALEADTFQKIGHPLACLRAGSKLVFEIRLGNCGAHRHARIEAGERILEDHLHGPAHVAQLLRIHGQHILAVEQDFAALRLDKAHDRASGRRLAAAGFADQ